MIPSQIEKEIVIEAPIDVVWRVLTEPEHMKEWFAPRTELVGRSGAAGVMVFPSGETYYLKVERFEPPHRFAYRWLHEAGADPAPENSMLVEFTLESEDGRTRMRLVESGFDHVDWTDERKTEYFNGHTNGWQTILKRLSDYAAQVDR